jgi:hypothetical protein
MLKIKLNSKKRKNGNMIKSIIVPRLNSLNLLRDIVDVGWRKQLFFCVKAENIFVKILRPLCPVGAVL